MITVALYKQITCMIPDIQILNVLFRYLLLNNCGQFEDLVELRFRDQ